MTEQDRALRDSRARRGGRDDEDDGMMGCDA